MSYASPVDISDPINGQILAVSEDKVQGFAPDPLERIAQQSGVAVAIVAERIAEMLRAGTIRRVRQTLMSVSLAQGALIAWKVPPEKLNAAFDFMFQRDPFSGHIVVRSTDKETAGSQYRLWTTLKIPAGFSMAKHCDLLCRITGAEGYKIMPAKKVFALGVGHVRRRGMAPGGKADAPAEVHDTRRVELSEKQWQVLTVLKREFSAEEILRAAERPGDEFWSERAAEAGASLEDFLQVGRQLEERRVIGRFSTFLEHVKPNAAGQRVTTYNALFHWAVPAGREMEAGMEVGRFHIMTHAYWREGGDEFKHVNVMGVAHGTDKEMVLAHKAAIDAHLASPEGGAIPVSYTNVFWGGRSEIKPSEISPVAYEAWLRGQNIDPAAMRPMHPEQSS